MGTVRARWLSRETDGRTTIDDRFSGASRHPVMHPVAHMRASGSFFHRRDRGRGIGRTDDANLRFVLFVRRGWTNRRGCARGTNERTNGRTDRARAGGRGADSDAKTKTFVSFERRLSPLENWDGRRWKRGRITSFEWVCLSVYRRIGWRARGSKGGGATHVASHPRSAKGGLGGRPGVDIDEGTNEPSGSGSSS